MLVVLLDPGLNGMGSLFNVDLTTFHRIGCTEAQSLLIQHFEEAILRIFYHVLTSSFFRFNGQFYEQSDGVAMGSPGIAESFVEYFEEIATRKPLCWFTM
jgi:hypothetical protein